MILTLKTNYQIVRNFAQLTLVIAIVLFSFFVSFDPSIGKNFVNNMFYIWILSLNFMSFMSFIKNNRIFLLIIIFFLWITFTVIITSTINYYNYDTFIKYFLLPILIIVTTIKKEHIKYIVSAFLLGMFINEIISYGIYFEVIQSKFFGFNIVGSKSNPVPFLTSHIEYTQFLSLAIVISVFTFFNTKNIFFKIILAIFFITMTTNLFLTTGRTGQFTLLMTLIFLIIIYFRNNIKYIFLGFLSIVVIFILAFNLSSNTNHRLKSAYNDLAKVITENNYESSWGVRLSSYIIIPKIIENENFNIFYGMGYCEVDNIIQKIHINEFGEDNIFARTFGHLHNTYITIFAGTGIIGITIFFIIWYHLFMVKIYDKYLNYLRYSFLFVVTFGGFSSNLFWQREVMLLSAIFISIIIVLSRDYSKEKKDE